MIVFLRTYKEEGLPGWLLTRRWARAGLYALFLMLTAQALAVECEPIVARMVSLQGVIEFRRAQSAQWSAASVDTLLCAGDAVRVGERSRAALLLVNQSLVRLDQHATLTFAAPEQGLAFIDLLRGALNVLTRTPKPFTVRTPFLNAGVEGTEFLVRVDTDEAQIVVFEGRVSASNDAGEVRLASGEQAMARADAAPRRERVVRPVDAVQWALYYPSILDSSVSEDVSHREAGALARSGRTSEAFARLDAVPEAERGARHHVYHAELLLNVGRVDEARTQIARAFARDARSGEARALEALIAVVHNDEIRAMRLARESVEWAPRSPTAHLALSYAAQARFDLPAALASSEVAVTLAPGSALAWARAAELRMASGDLGAALAAAQRAAAITSDLARTQTVLGFAHLARLESAAARQAFERAVELDQADYLPRLGLGLALIRDNELGAGREAIEVAAGLDPLHSLTRSYLGKAYFEERRQGPAHRQFDLAKTLDPNDPTPWLYDALAKQRENRPVEALGDLEQAIALNDNRLVYRSRLLLDEDRASRGVSVARIYRDLGFNELAVAAASQSLAVDPTSDSAHRFLSDAYAELPRHEVARASALLQSMLLQPLRLPQPQPSAPFIDVVRVAPSRFPTPGFNEYSMLFERQRSQVSVAALTGSNGARGDEISASLLFDQVALGLGQYQYRFDGFHPNGDVRHDIYNAFAQWAASPKIMLQMELRHRKTRHGDIAFEFDPADFLAISQVRIEQQTARLGLTYRPSARMRVIASVMNNERRERQLHDDSGLEIGLTGNFPGRQSELQFQWLHGLGNLTLGLGSSRVRFDVQGRFVDRIGVLGGACTPADPCDSSDLNTIRQANGYVHVNLTPRSDLTATLGFSRDEYSDEGLDLRLWNPKFGVRWQASNWLGVRAAAFKTVKRALIVDQTIEPTQIGGFNQFFDDINGTRTRTLAVALDLGLPRGIKGLLEVNRRRLRLGPSLVGADLAAGPFEQWQERALAAGMFWPLGNRTAITLQYRRDRFERDALVLNDQPISVTTSTVPITARHFLPNGLSVLLSATRVKQQVARLPGSFKQAGEDAFVVVDTALSYRIPRLDATVNLAVINALDARFSYQDDNFRSSQTHLPRYMPGRNIVLSASLSF